MEKPKNDIVEVSSEIQEEVIRRVCSWCKILLDPENGPLDPKDKITHTVCPSCEEKILSTLEDEDT